MRTIPNDIKKKLDNNIQTKDNNSNIDTSLIINRPIIPLVSNDFLEHQEVLKSGASSVSIAVSHLQTNKNNNEIFIGYVTDGIAKVIKATTKIKMEDHNWILVPYDKPASAISIAFDGTMPKNAMGKEEFITEKNPWIFRVHNGTMYASKPGAEEVILAESGCNDVSAIRAMWSSFGNFDFGLVVFFIVNGSLYYRQYINGEWYDAETVNVLSDNVWTNVSAFRTWDYRIGVQIKNDKNEIYEIFTQFMGIGKQTVEHIEIDNVSIESKLTTLHKHTTKTDEYIQIDNVSIETGIFYGLLLATPPKIIESRNIADENNDYGKMVTIKFDTLMNRDNLSENANNFSIIDSRNRQYNCSELILSDDYQTATLLFPDFNTAYGECKLSYKKGTVKSYVNTIMDDTYILFTPINLNPPKIDPPKPVSAINIGDQGSKIEITFTEYLVGAIDGNESKFEISLEEYNYVPNGKLMPASRSVKSFENIDKTLTLVLGTGNVNSIQNAVGDVRIKYSNGTLIGDGGPVADFEITFTPTEMVSKNNPMSTEHISISLVDVKSDYIGLTKHTTKSQDEHINIETIDIVSSLIHVDDV